MFVLKLSGKDGFFFKTLQPYSIIFMLVKKNIYLSQDSNAQLFFDYDKEFRLLYS